MMKRDNVVQILLKLIDLILNEMIFFQIEVSYLEDCHTKNWFHIKWDLVLFDLDHLLVILMQDQNLLYDLL